MAEDVSGLPDVKGLDQFIQDATQDKGTQQAASTQATNTEQIPQATTTQTDGEIDLGQFKNPKDLLKSYKEIQGAFTRVTQENKTFKEQLAKVSEQMQLMQYAQPQYASPQPVQPQDFDTQFINNPKEAINSVVEAKVQERLKAATIESVLVEENSKNPAEFQERYQYASLVAKTYPQLVNTSLGVRKLFELGDQYRKEVLQRQAKQAMSFVFGDDVDLERLKSQFKKNPQTQSNINNAYMPDTSFSNRTDTGTDAQKGYDTQIQASVAKGDVDSVISNLLKQKLEA